MMNRDQLRAARVLLHLDQRELAVLAKVNVVTVRRFEGGEEIGSRHHDQIREAVEEAGAILFEAGCGVDGSAIQGGVALKTLAECSEATRERFARDDFGRRKTGKPEGRAARSREKLASKRAEDATDGN